MYFAAISKLVQLAKKKHHPNGWCFFFIVECGLNNTLLGYETDERCSLGEVASARSARKSERNEAQRSKFIGAPSRNEFWEPQEAEQSEAIGAGAPGQNPFIYDF